MASDLFGDYVDCVALGAFETMDIRGGRMSLGDDLTDEQKHRIYHASGIGENGRQYRDHYYVHGKDPVMLDMVAKGYFEGPHYNSWSLDGHGYFYLTENGIDMAWKIDRLNKEKERAK